MTFPLWITVRMFLVAAMLVKGLPSTMTKSATLPLAAGPMYCFMKAADRREVPDVRARLGDVPDVARPESSRRARQQGTEHASARHEEPRPLHDAALQRGALRDDPRRVAVNVADRGHAMRQVERDLPAAQVEVHVDQARGGSSVRWSG